jgi:hypothetical protein
MGPLRELRLREK